MDVRSRGQEPGTVLQRRPHNDRDCPLVVRVPPCLLCYIFPAIPVLKSKVELVVVQARAVLSEMTFTPEMAQNNYIIIRFNGFKFDSYALVICVCQSIVESTQNKSYLPSGRYKKTPSS